MPPGRGLCKVPGKPACQYVCKSQLEGIGDQIGSHTPQQDQPQSAACVQVKPRAAASIAGKLPCKHGGELSKPLQGPVDQTGKEQEHGQKTTKKAAGTKKTAKKSDETPKKTTRKKKTEAAE